jgi:hypothetical protein
MTDLIDSGMVGLVDSGLVGLVDSGMVDPSMIDSGVIHDVQRIWPL